MGTSENRTPLNSAPMYSLKSLEFSGVTAWIDENAESNTRKIGRRSMAVGTSELCFRFVVAREGINASERWLN